MSDIDNMRTEFLEWVVKNDGCNAWEAWQVATERAAKLAYNAGMDGLAHAIRQGGDT